MVGLGAMIIGKVGAWSTKRAPATVGTDFEEKQGIR